MLRGRRKPGTGKTAAFLLATFNHLLKHAPAEEPEPAVPRAVIMAPTRELAVQIHADALVLGGHTGLRIRLVYRRRGL